MVRAFAGAQPSQDLRQIGGVVERCGELGEALSPVDKRRDPLAPARRRPRPYPRALGRDRLSEEVAVVELEVARLVLNQRSQDQILTLRERGGAERSFTMTIGLFEAVALQHVINGEASPRPLTHELLLASLTVLDAELIGVILDDVQEDVFYAKLTLRRGGREHLVDARPSDALTLALRAEVPIQVSDRVINVASSR